VKQLPDAAREYDGGFNRAVDLIAFTKESTQSTEPAARAGTQLSPQAEKLQAMVSKFRVKVGRNQDATRPGPVHGPFSCALRNPTRKRGAVDAPHVRCTCRVREQL
jgi:hypothetical protein